LIMCTINVQFFGLVKMYKIEYQLDIQLAYWLNFHYVYDTL